MSILGCDPNDADALVAAVAHAAGSDWRAAGFLLQHHPQHRELYGDQAHDQRLRRQLIAQVVAAIAAAALPPDDERRVLLQLQAHGVGSAECPWRNLALNR
ncbi:MAG: hypothetical protein NTW51_04910 [Cyanobacteria bacterium]|nr:hypothetical protein [Cyanobacteriota bacterium]